MEAAELESGTQLPASFQPEPAFEPQPGPQIPFFLGLPLHAVPGPKSGQNPSVPPVISGQ